MKYASIFHQSQKHFYQYRGLFKHHVHHPHHPNYQQLDDPWLLSKASELLVGSGNFLPSCHSLDRIAVISQNSSSLALLHCLHIIIKCTAHGSNKPEQQLPCTLQSFALFVYNNCTLHFAIISKNSAPCMNSIPLPIMLFLAVLMLCISSNAHNYHHSPSSS